MEDLGNSCRLCSVFASDSKKVLGGAPRGTNVRRQNGIAKRDRTWRDQGSRVGQFSKIFFSDEDTRGENPGKSRRETSED